VNRIAAATKSGVELSRVDNAAIWKINEALQITSQQVLIAPQCPMNPGVHYHLSEKVGEKSSPMWGITVGELLIVAYVAKSLLRCLIIDAV
jgi:hypothetical protein